MTSAELLKVVGVLTKDPDNEVYTEDIVYTMLSAAQDAIVSAIHPSYLRRLIISYDRSDIPSPGKFILEDDFYRPVYFERISDKVEVEYIELDQKGRLRNKLEGGTDYRPVWVMFEESGVMFGQVIVDTYPFSGRQYYIRKPPPITYTIDPIISGLDNLLILYFKHLFHLAEGQPELAGIALKSFEDFIMTYNERAKVLK